LKDVSCSPFTVVRLLELCEAAPGVRDAIEGVGAMLRYLPPYSPDLNPIEMAYGAFKAFLCKCAERTEDALIRRTGQIVRRLEATACANFVAHVGYAI
jgi:hypothetical protein